MEGSNVGVVAGFDGTDRQHRAHVWSAKGAIMGDVADAGFGISDQSAQHRQAAGSIADSHFEATKSAICNQAFFDYPAQDGRVNIAAAHGEDHAFVFQARQFSRQHRPQWGRCGALDDGFLEFGIT
jgi:hypothetical protein